MRVRTAAWVLWGIGMAFTAGALALLFVTRDVAVPDAWGFRGFTTTFAIGMGTVGVLIVAARRNLVGWILLIAGLISGVQDFAEQYAIYGLLARPGSVPVPEYFAWLESWTWVITVAMVAIYLPLVFPNGRLDGPRWRFVAWGAAAVTLALVAGLAVNDGPLNNAPFVRNPFAVAGLRLLGDASGGPAEVQNSPLFFALYLPLFLSAAAAVASIVGRSRKASGIERQQIKWYAFGAAVAALGMVVGGTLQQFKAAQVMFILAIQFIPIVVAIAVLRYRLYDIDVVINRALVYGVTVAIVGAGFIAAALFLQTLLRPITAGSDVAIAASTLATVAAFQPLRRWVQGAIDRRFYRSRYDAARTLDVFAVRMRDQVDIDAVRAEVLDVVGTTVRPTHASVWLRPPA